MSNKWIFSGIGIFVLGGVFFVGFAEGQGVLPSRLDKAVAIVKQTLSADYIKQLARGAGECDQSATSTDCSKVTVQDSSIFEPQNNAKLNLTFGPLANTYADAKYGFKLKYPDELVLIDGGDLQLVDKRNEKAFSLKICNPESPCGRELSDASVKSAQQVRNTYVVRQYENGGVEYKEEVRPVSTVSIQTESGASVLKQSYSTVILDSKGVDVTTQECEMCSGQKSRYVVFKDTNSYLVIQVTGLANDKALEERIVRSITY
jgi:hypothetical protein